MERIRTRRICLRYRSIILSMEYFYIEPEEVRSTIITLKDDEHKHLFRVLRKKIGDRIVITDGNGRTFEAILRHIDHDVAECEVTDVRENVNEPVIHITLAISLLRNPARFEFAIEKGTELGVRQFIPIYSERTIPDHAKIARYQKIAQSAMKQSCRSFLPEITVLTKFDSFVDYSSKEDLKLIPHEKTEQSQSLGTVLNHHREASSVLMVIGPEGGFTDREIELAIQRGFIPISLGPRRLRSETAAISAISSIVKGT